MTTFPQTWVTTRVPYGSSTVMMKTPTRAVVLIEVSRVVGLAQAAKNQCGGERGRALFSRWGKVVVGATGGFFYRPKSPSTSRTTSRIVYSTESNILQEFIRFDTNLILGSFCFASVPS
jgi:hypothetical protein